jgi:DNA-binding Xre family transcriptional regulator
MIKTDAQLERTLNSIRDFEQELEEVKMLEDPTARELGLSSSLGMIASLRLEVERYQNAKNGTIEVPEAFSSVQDFCPYLTDIRIALGWSQERLAEQLGVTRQAVNKWEEHDYREIGVDRLAEILSVLGIRISIHVDHQVVRMVHPHGAAYRIEEPAVAVG